jgi:hypothetical protein
MNISYKTILIGIITFFINAWCYAQISKSYSFSTGTGGVLTDMTGSTILLGTNVDDQLSPLFDLPFAIKFNGMDYTQFIASSNGYMTLGGSEFNRREGGFNTIGSFVVLAPYWVDADTRSGKVHMKNANGLFTVEWLTAIPYKVLNVNSRFQIQIDQQSMSIRFVYGDCAPPLFFDNITPNGTVGIADEDQDFSNVDLSTHTASSDLLPFQGVAPSIGRFYLWTPVSGNAVSFVGIGNAYPKQTLDIKGIVRIRGGSPGNGKILQSDYFGNARWADPPTVSGLPAGQQPNQTLRYTSTGWIATNALLLESSLATVTNRIKILGGSPGEGKVLTSDANGLATWETPSINNNYWSLSGNSLFNSSGTNIGIGTSTPSARLDIAGSGNWDLSNTEGDMRLGNSLYRLKFGVALGGPIAGTSYIYSAGGVEKLNLGVSNINLLTLNGDNRGVGIGTETPAERLDVNGNITLSGFILNDLFQEPELMNNWIPFESSDRFAKPGYYKDKENRVHLRGSITGGIFDPKTILFTLPDGYAPFAGDRLCFITAANNSYARIEIDGRGNVILASADGNEFLSLDGISFRAD